MARSLVDRILEQMTDTFWENSWNPSVTALLEGLTPQQAAWRPAEGGHTIWEMVQHLAYGKRVITARLRGEPGQWDEEQNWAPAPSEPDPDQWQAAVDDLKAAHRDLTAALFEVDDAFLTQPQGPRGWVPLHGVLGLVHHDSWHGGQIAYLRRMQGLPSIL